MKNLAITFTLFLLLAGVISSCSDDKLYQEKAAYTTVFSVYECNENYANSPASTSFVSIGAEISIWVKDYTDSVESYKKVNILVTGEDGKAVYKHNYPLFYYTVENVSEDNEDLSNLATPLKGTRSLANKFQVAGVFFSDEDIKKSPQYNLPHLSEKYTPKVGSVKFKDINGDGIIDLKDSIDKIAIYSFTDKAIEETIYIATNTN